MAAAVVPIRNVINVSRYSRRTSCGMDIKLQPADPIMHGLETSKDASDDEI